MKRSHNQGVSLVAVIVALGVATILALVTAEILQHGYQAQKNVELKADLISLRSQLNDAFDCKKTVASLPGGKCTIDHLVALWTTKPAPRDIIVSANPAKPTKIGRYTVRATCKTCATCPGNKMILVEAAVFDQQGNVVKDPLTGKALNWTDLNRGIPLGCIVP